MKISTKGRYALRVMIDLAQHQGEGYISLRDVANRQEISIKYLEMVVSILHRYGFVRSQRGKSCGYQLAVAAEECTVGAVLKATEGSLAPVACLSGDTFCCGRGSSCPTLPLWKELSEVIDRFLESKTIAELAENTQKEGTI